MSSDGLAALRIDRTRPRRRVPPWVWLVGVAIVSAAILAPRLMGGVSVVEVGVSPAVRISATGKVVDGSPELTAAGYVVADRQSVLATKFTGRLAKLNVAEADAVKLGDVVAEIDHEELDASIDRAKAAVAEAVAEVERYAKLAAQAQAGMAAAEAALKTIDAENKQYEILKDDAKRRFELAERLVARSAAAASEVDDRRTEMLAAEAKIAWTRQRAFEAEQQVVVAQSQAAAAQAAVESAKARQKSAEANVAVLESQRGECFILAPFDGVVTEKAAEVGEIVAPISIGGSMARGSIVTIADLASLQAEVDVAESQLQRVKPGDKARIKVDAIPNREFEGRVRRILPRADRSKATVKVRVDFLDRDDQAVLPEMGVRVRFLDEKAPAGAIAVPRAAVQPGESGSYVWVVSNDQAHRQTVEIGPNSGERVEITRGLAAGDKVVVRGAQRLTGDAVPVQVVE